MSLDTIGVANNLEDHVTSLHQGLLKASQIDKTKEGSIEQGEKIAYEDIAARLKKNHGSNTSTF